MLALVSGYSGLGKSSVVQELHKALVPSGGLFASGKFDQYKRGIPYATIAQAFQGLVGQLLGKAESELARWREALTEAMGQNGQLMVNLIPDLALIVGTQPPVSDLSPQDAQSRFQIVFRRFLGVFARPEHPLVLFLDDLQWLDSATLGLMSDFLVHPDVQHLLVVGAYRDNEVGPDHPLTSALTTIRRSGGHVREISLGALRIEHVEELLGASLRTDRDRVRPLAALIFERTGGNPLFVIHFMTELAAEGLLSFDTDASAWSWDLQGIHAKDFTDNVADLMASRLGRLPQATLAALEQMASVGNAVQAATLATVLDRSESETHLALWPAIHADLVAFQDGSYQFLHDRIQEAAYARIRESDRSGVHLRIGRLLAARQGPERLDGDIFEIVDQMVRGADLIESDAERREVANLNLAAGKRAKAGTAYASALRYLSSAQTLLPDDAWDSCYRLAFDVELGLAECEFLTGNLAEAEKRITSLLARALNDVDRAAATRVFLDLTVTHGGNGQGQRDRARLSPSGRSSVAQGRDDRARQPGV